MLSLITRLELGTPLNEPDVILARLNSRLLRANLERSKNLDAVVHRCRLHHERAREVAARKTVAMLTKVLQEQQAKARLNQMRPEPVVIPDEATSSFGPSPDIIYTPSQNVDRDDSDDCSSDCSSVPVSPSAFYHSPRARLAPLPAGAGLPQGLAPRAQQRHVSTTVGAIHSSNLFSHSALMVRENVAVDSAAFERFTEDDGNLAC